MNNYGPHNFARSAVNFTLPLLSYDLAGFNYLPIIYVHVSSHQFYPNVNSEAKFLLCSCMALECFLCRRNFIRRRSLLWWTRGSCCALLGKTRQDFTSEDRHWVFGEHLT